MALNIGVRGRVVDAYGRGWPDLVVDARDLNLLVDEFLGRTRTDASGTFELSYTPENYLTLVD